MTDTVARFDARNDGREGVPPKHPAAVAVERLAQTASRLAKMVDSPLRRVRVQYGEAVVELEWPQEQRLASAQEPSGTAPQPQAGPQPAAPADSGQSEHHHVTAPMVGNFYHAPEPGAPPFVKVGDQVEEGQDIGIVEAMKLMNPVQAERAGRVVAMLVGDGDPVEYGQALIALEPTEPVE